MSPEQRDMARPWEHWIQGLKSHQNFLIVVATFLCTAASSVSHLSFSLSHSVTELLIFCLQGGSYGKLPSFSFYKIRLLKRASHLFLIFKIPRKGF